VYVRILHGLIQLLPCQERHLIRGLLQAGASINSGQGTRNITVRFNTASSTNAVLSVRSRNACGSSANRTLNISVNLDCKVADESAAIEQSNMLSALTAYPNPTTGRATVTSFLRKMLNINSL